MRVRAREGFSCAVRDRAAITLSHVVYMNAKLGTLQAPPTWRVVLDHATATEARLFAVADDWLNYILLIHAEIGTIRISSNMHASAFNCGCDALAHD
jgi:hypothetical protein